MKIFNDKKFKELIELIRHSGHKINLTPLGKLEYAGIILGYTKRIEGDKMEEKYLSELILEEEKNGVIVRWHIQIIELETKKEKKLLMLNRNLTDMGPVSRHDISEFGEVYKVYRELKEKGNYEAEGWNYKIIRDNLSEQTIIDIKSEMVRREMEKWE